MEEREGSWGGPEADAVGPGMPWGGWEALGGCLPGSCSLLSFLKGQEHAPLFTLAEGLL